MRLRLAIVHGAPTRDAANPKKHANKTSRGKASSGPRTCTRRPSANSRKSWLSIRRNCARSISLKGVLKGFKIAMSQRFSPSNKSKNPLNSKSNFPCSGGDPNATMKGSRLSPASSRVNAVPWNCEKNARSCRDENLFVFCPRPDAFAISRSISSRNTGGGMACSSASPTAPGNYPRQFSPTQS